jgi:peroxiredoxin
VAILAASPALAGPLAIGDKTPNSNSLRDLHGSIRSLESFKDQSAIVIAFLGTDCPVSNLYLPGLIDLEKKFRSKKVQFLAVYPHESEDLDQIAVHSYDRNVPFLVLKDVHHKLADSLGITRVPTVAVLDGQFTLRYRGRVDDQYGVAHRKDKTDRADLALAIEEVISGVKVSVAETEADGCLLDVGKKPTAKDVTYSKSVAPILQNKCQSCHRPDQTAPFALMNYDEAAKHAKSIREVTTQRRMPPWHADPRHGSFTNDRRLTKEEIDTINAWVEGGLAKGDDKDLPKPIAWPKGWSHGEPDLVLSMPEDFEVPATGSLGYKHYVIDPKFTEDKWVSIAEGKPGEPSVVHHIVVYILKAGEKQPFTPDGGFSVLVGWAPGDLGLVCPPDTALRLPKGCQLRFEMHYTPNGKVTKDKSSVGIKFAKAPPKYELYFNSFVNESILLPPFESHYRSEATWRLPADARILGFTPHMHWRGKHYFYEAITPDGKKQTLLSVPRWDFNWQNSYWFKEPIKVAKGTRLHSVAHWDNSINNPYNPAPEKSVRFGLQTWDEMMVGWVAYVWENPDTPAELAKNPPKPAELFFDRLDRNADDIITADEFPPQMKPFMEAAGMKIPEKMNREEFTKFFEEMRKLFPRP